MRSYFVYIAGSPSRTLYVGVTNDINRRMYEHREGLIPGFAKTYGVKRLLYVEATDDVQEALERERQIKRWRREKKEHLIAMQTRNGTAFQGIPPLRLATLTSGRNDKNQGSLIRYTAR